MRWWRLCGPGDCLGEPARDEGLPRRKPRSMSLLGDHLCLMRRQRVRPGEGRPNFSREGREGTHAEASWGGRDEELASFPPRRRRRARATQSSWLARLALTRPRLSEAKELPNLFLQGSSTGQVAVAARCNDGGLRSVSRDAGREAPAAPVRPTRSPRLPCRHDRQGTPPSCLALRARSFACRQGTGSCGSCTSQPTHRREPSGA